MFPILWLIFWVKLIIIYFNINKTNFIFYTIIYFSIDMLLFHISYSQTQTNFMKYFLKINIIISQLKIIAYVN